MNIKAKWVEEFVNVLPLVGRKWGRMCFAAVVGIFRDELFRYVPEIRYFCRQKNFSGFSNVLVC